MYIVYILHRKNSIYLTEIPKLSAMYLVSSNNSKGNVYMVGKKKKKNGTPNFI